jgi:hypothetical protein
MTAAKEPQAQIRATAGLQKSIEAAIIGSDCPSRVMHVAEEIKELVRRLANGEPNDIAPSQLCEAAELPAGSTWGEALKLWEERIDTQERHDEQVDKLIDALIDQEEYYGPYAALLEAALDAAETDCPEHSAPAKDLLPFAIERVKEHSRRFVSWDWKPDSDEILSEMNRVLEPHCLKFVDVDFGGDEFVFELKKV